MDYLFTDTDSSSCNSTFCFFQDLDLNLTGIIHVRESSDKRDGFVHFANVFYTYVTIAVLLVGLTGNVLSLVVFLSRNLRAMPVSRYLLAISVSDICSLVFYVLSEWLKRGLPQLADGYRVRFFDTDGICQLWLYLSYVARFVSAWLIVCFTVERFVGVCMPFRRRSMGSTRGAQRIVVGVVATGAVVLIYKPTMSAVRTIRNRSACSSKEGFVHASFVLDTIYALLITLVPFIIISILNCLIIFKLYRRRRKRRVSNAGNQTIRNEFTVILLAISFFFIAFNLPYFVVWFRYFLHARSTRSSHGDTSDTWIGILQLTRTIFYMNYCVNFFLYSVTGEYFRRELRALFCGRADYKTVRLKAINSSTYNPSGKDKQPGVKTTLV